MTIEQLLLKKLTAHGLWEEEAKAIVEAVKLSNSPMAERWNEDQSACPPDLFAVLWVSATQEALKWIDKNKPQHWARPMFQGGVSG